MKLLKCLILGIIAFCTFYTMNVEVYAYSRIDSYDRVAQIDGDCYGCIKQTFPYYLHVITVASSFDFIENTYEFFNDFYTLNLNGKTLTSKDLENKYETLFTISSGTTLTIADYSGGGKIEGGILVNAGGTLIIEGGTFGNSMFERAAIVVNGGNVTINGGTFIGKNGGIQVTDPASTLKIKSGSFSSMGENNYGGILMIKQDSTPFNAADLLITGSKFFDSSFEEKNIGDTTFYASQKSVNVYSKHDISISEEITNGSVSANVNSECFGETITLTTTPNTGYDLKSVKIYKNNTDVTSLVKYNTTSNTFTMPDYAVTVLAEFKKSDYVVTNGNSQTHKIGTTEDAVFEIDADKDLFSKVYLDNVELDSTFYTVTEGSTIITLKQDFLNNLLPNTYNLKVTFTDGGEANATFVISAQENNPQTGDSIMISLILGIISLIGLLGTSIYLKGKRFN